MNALRLVARASAAPGLADPGCPIGQTFRSDDPRVQSELMHAASERPPVRDDARLVADCNALRVRARSESALNRVEEWLRGRFGGSLIADAPYVRYGAGTRVLEPWMRVLLHGRRSDRDRIRNDLVSRGGCVLRLQDGEDFVLEGEAPLAALLGYARHVKALLGPSTVNAYVGIWLARYVPVRADAESAAAIRPPDAARRREDALAG
jgi:hypothetical protein